MSWFRLHQRIIQREAWVLLDPAFHDVHQFDGFSEVAVAVEMDGIYEPICYFHFHYLFGKQFNILSACGLEITEVVAAVKVVRIDLCQTVFGVLHPHQDNYAQRLIHDVTDRTQERFMLECIIYLIDYDYSISMIFQNTQTALEQVIGSSIR